MSHDSLCLTREGRKEREKERLNFREMCAEWGKQKEGESHGGVYIIIFRRGGVMRGFLGGGRKRGASKRALEGGRGGVSGRVEKIGERGEEGKRERGRGMWRFGRGGGAGMGGGRGGRRRMSRGKTAINM